MKITYTPTNADELMIIGAVRMIARERDWNVVNEHWLDGDILELLSEVDMDLPKALKNIEHMVAIKREFTQSN